MLVRSSIETAQQGRCGHGVIVCRVYCQACARNKLASFSEPKDVVEVYRTMFVNVLALVR